MVIKDKSDLVQPECDSRAELEVAGNAELGNVQWCIANVQQCNVLRRAVRTHIRRSKAQARCVRQIQLYRAANFGERLVIESDTGKEDIAAFVHRKAKELPEATG